ncbi:MAG: glycosyltransferase family 2 protein [Infirmifilum sp.]
MLDAANLFFLIVDTVSVFTITSILLWTLYHIPIVTAGITSKKRQANVKTPSNPPRLTVIIPVKDEPQKLKRCLESLSDTDYPREKLEIIVVDGSADSSCEAVVREFTSKNHQTINFIREEKPKGKPAALNAALRLATGDIVAVFDADSVPDKHVFTRAASLFEDPSVVAVQGRTEPLNSSSLVSRTASKEEHIWHSAILQGRQALNLFVPLTGSCQFIRRDMLLKLGGWSEDVLAEDLELSLKLFETGYKVIYLPTAVSKQEVPSTLKGLIVQRSRWYRGYMEATLKHFKQILARSWRGLDALVLTSGPFLMVLSFIAIMMWFLTLLFPHNNNFTTQATLVLLLNAASIVTLGLALAFADKPARLRNLAWIPFIYIYWFTLTAVATLSLLEIIARRPRVWRKTPKED